MCRDHWKRGGLQLLLILATGFVIVRRHHKQILHALPIRQVHPIVQFMCFQQVKPLQREGLDLIFIGHGIQRLLQLPQMLRPGNSHQKDTAGCQCTANLLSAIGRKNVDRTGEAAVRHGQVEGAGYGKSGPRAGPGRLSQGDLGNINPIAGDPARILLQCLRDQRRIVALAAPDIQQTAIRHKAHGTIGNLLRQRPVSAAR